MKFARIVFFLAGIWGLLILTPMYFMESEVARQSGPVTHPEHYYGFIGVALTWQVLFLVLSKDPARYRLMMLPAVLEKISFALSTFILYQLDRVASTIAAIAGIDLIWAILFIAAFLKTGNSQKQT